MLAFGEEVGWRAFALPQLIERFGLLKDHRFSGGLWCIWHYPKLFASPFLKLNGEAVLWVTLFPLKIFVANFLICWLFVKTRSVFVTTLFQASWSLMATAYLFGATDPFITALLFAATTIAVGISILKRDPELTSTSGL